MKTRSIDKKTLLSLVLVGCLSLAVATSRAQISSSANDADPRLVAAMERSGIEYEIDEDDDVKVIKEWDDGRSQAVWANTNTETYEGIEIREVWAIVTEYDSADDILARVLFDLLQANFNLKFGKYAILEDESTGKVHVRFILTVSADLDGATLAKVISFVGEVADEKEIELEDNEADEF